MRSYEDRKTALFNTLRAGTAPMRYSEIRGIMGGDAAVKKLEAEGLIERIGAGVYAEPGRDTTWDGLATLSCLHPEGVVCLETAAMYHGLTDANPDELHMAFPVSKRVPVHPELNVRGYRWSSRFLEEGVADFDIGRMAVAMTDRSRTVVDFVRRMEATGMVEEAMGVMRAYFESGGAERDLLKSAKSVGAQDAMVPVLRGVMSMRRGF